MPTQRPENAHWSMEQMLSWLAELQGRAREEYAGAAAYIHPAPLTFTNDGQKIIWLEFQESIEKRHTIQKLEKARKDKARTWIALCDTPSESYVSIPLTDDERARGVKQWDKVDWHTWGLAIVPASRGSGRYGYIFDCDQALPPKSKSKSKFEFHAKNLTTQTQRQFVSVFKRWGVKRLFVGNAGVDRGNLDRCLAETTEWVQKMAEARGDGGAGDGRFVGFVEIGLNT